MAIFPKFKLTKIGEELLNKCISEGRTLTFTKFKIGSGVPTQDWRDLTDIRTVFKTFPVLETSVQKNQVLRIKGYFDNKGFVEDKKFKEIGIFVSLQGIEGEFLYSYTNAGDTGDIIPAESKSFFSRTLDVSNYISSATNITFNIEVIRDNYDFNTEAEVKAATFLKKGDKIRLWGRSALGDIDTINYIVTDEVTSFTIDNGLYCELAANTVVADVENGLKNLKGAKVGDVVEVLGYYDKGDGAGHLRKKMLEGYIGTDAVTAADGSIWGIVHNGEVNVSWFGAKGDGVTDDTAAVKKAAEYGVVNFDNKVHLIENLIINNDIIAKGNNTIFKAKLFADGNTKNIINSNTDNLNIMFKNIIFDGSCDLKGTTNLDNMLRIKKANIVTFDNCEFTRYGALDKDEKVYLYDRLGVMAQIFNCKEVNIINCKYYNNRGNEQMQVMTDGTVDCVLNVRDNKIYDNTEAFAWLLPMNLKRGFVSKNYLNGNRRTFINLMSSNIIITNNHIANTSSRGIASESGGLARTENIIIENNYIENCAEGAINVAGGDIVVTGNKVKDCGNYACRIGGITIDTKWNTYNPLAPTKMKIVKNVKIYDNDFSDTNGQIRILNEIKGVEKSYCEDVIIKDNSLKNAGFLFYLNNCKKINVIDNNIKNYGTNTSVILFRFEDSNSDITLKGNVIEGYMYSLARTTSTEEIILENLFIRGNNFKSAPSNLLIGNLGATIKNILIENNENFFTYLTDSEYNAFLNVVKFYNGNTTEQSFAKFGTIKKSDGTFVSITKNCTKSNRVVSGIVANSLDVGFGEFSFNSTENVRVGDTFTFNTGFVGTVVHIAGNKVYTSPSPSVSIVNSNVSFVGVALLDTTALNTPYYISKMENLGILKDYYTYLDEVYEYEKTQNTTQGISTLNIVSEPTLPKSVEDFAKEYGLL